MGEGKVPNTKLSKTKEEMSYNVELHPEEIVELKNSYQWYEERSEGLGAVSIP